MKYVSEQEVDSLLQARELTDLLEQCFIHLHNGVAVQQPRSRVISPPYVQHTLAAVSQALGVSAVKTYVTGPFGATFVTLLFELASGRHLATIESARLGQLRTGCATALATRVLFGKGPARLGLIGTGFVARGQLEALRAEYPGLEARVYSPRGESRVEFEQWAGGNVEMVEIASDACWEANLVVTATASAQPVIAGDHLGESGLLCAVGGNAPKRREIDGSVLRRCREMWVDCPLQARKEAGEFLADPDFNWDKVKPLAAAVASRPGAVGEGWRLFKSLGVGIEDLAAAWLIAKKTGLLA